MVFYSMNVISAQIEPDSPDCLETLLEYRGDANSNGKIDISDAVYLLNFLFQGGSAPKCLEQADVNNDGKIDLSDAVSILGYLFLEKEPPIGIDKAPYLAMPSEVKLILNDNVLFDNWFSLNFEGDVISCKSIAYPEIEERDPITLFAFQRDKEYPILDFFKGIETIFSPKDIPTGPYEVITQCEDVKGHIGTSVTDLRVSSYDDQDADGEIDSPPSDGICNAGVDQCCIRGSKNPETGEKSEDYLSICLENPVGGPDPTLCDKLEDFYAGDLYADSVEKCNEDQKGEGATVNQEQPELYCRVTCATVFYERGQDGGSSTANCKGKKVSLKDIHTDNPLKSEYDQENAYVNEEYSLGGNSGIVTQDIDKLVNRVKTRITVSNHQFGNAFLVYAQYVGVDEKGNIYDNVDGTLCREYQFIQSTTAYSEFWTYYLDSNIFKNKPTSVLSEATSTSLFEFWTGLEPGTNGFLKNRKSLFSLIDNDQINIRKGHSIDKNSKCRIDGPNHCIDDYHQMYPGEYTEHRSLLGAIIKKGITINTFYKEYHNIDKISYMMYRDNPHIESPINKANTHKSEDSFLIVIESQPIADDKLDNKIECHVKKHGHETIVNRDGTFTNNYFTGNCYCEEWKKKDSGWEAVGDLWEC